MNENYCWFRGAISFSCDFYLPHTDFKPFSWIPLSARNKKPAIGIVFIAD